MTKGESVIRNRQTAIVAAAFAVQVALVYFAGLDMPLVGPDEPRYAQVAREMFLRNDWITPTLGGFNWFEKPALLYWLQIASYNLFGVSEFAARFGSALFGLGTIAALWLLGRQVHETSNEQRPTIDFPGLLALVAASTIGLIAFAHGASFDIILTFPITAAMVSYFVYDARGKKAWLVSFYFFVGVAMLAKGLVGIVFPYAIVGFYHLLSWKFPSRNFILSLFWGTIVAALVASTWYVPMYLRNGYEFVDQFIIQHHFQRYTSNKYLHPQPFYFFFWVLPLMTIPWLPFFLAALWKLGKSALIGPPPGDAPPEARSLRIFAIAWIAVPLVFFSFSGSKLPGYILPVVPATIILTADFLYPYVARSRRWVYATIALAFGTFLIVSVSVLTFAPRFAEADSVRDMFLTAHFRGLDGLPVMTMHRVSHNAEFYATGPLMREQDGKQERFTGPREVLARMRSLGQRRSLVLIPPEYIHHLTDSDLITTEVLGSNEDWTLTLVSEK